MQMALFLVAVACSFVIQIDLGFIQKLILLSSARKPGRKVLSAEGT
jgi:hypothetical protein